MAAEKRARRRVRDDEDVEPVPEKPATRDGPGAALDPDEDEDELDDEVDADGKKPASRVAKTERIMNLVAFLLARSEPVPISEILGAVAGYDDKASKSSLMRRFERDKQVLREMGIPIDYCPPTTITLEGYTIRKEGYFLEELELPEGGALLLRALYAAASRGGAGELSDDLARSLLKLGFEVPGADPVELLAANREEGVPAPATEGRVLSVPFASAQRNLVVLTEAVTRRKRIRMRYWTISRDEEVRREVDPYGLGLAGQAWNKASWYLVGHCHLRNAPRVFKLDRIRGAVQIVKPASDEPDFEPAPGFQVRDHLNKNRWELRELAEAFARPGEKRSAGEPVTARVRFEKGVVAPVRGLVPHARIVSEDDRGCELAFDGVVDVRALARFLLPYVGQFEPLAPDALAGELAGLARDVLARYRAP